jgi:formiminotetrahydrofolate cyclodeaminase
MLDASTPIDQFLAATASKQPTPGGGAVAALCGATAAAIGEMVLNYSIGRKATPHLDPQLKPILDELTRARAMMLELMAEDQDAYGEFNAIKKEAESADKAVRLSVALDRSVAVPRAIAATAMSILDLADHAAENSNRWLLSDLAVCCELAMASLRSAIHNVRVNLPELESSRRQAFEGECDQLLTRAVDRLRKLLPRIEARMQAT